MGSIIRKKPLILFGFERLGTNLEEDRRNKNRSEMANAVAELSAEPEFERKCISYIEKSK